MRLVSARMALLRSARRRLAPLRSAPLRSARISLAPFRLAPRRSAALRSAPLRSAPLRSAPLRSARISLASRRLASISLAPFRSAPGRSANRVPWRHLFQASAPAAGCAAARRRPCVSPWWATYHNVQSATETLAVSPAISDELHLTSWLEGRTMLKRSVALAAVVVFVSAAPVLAQNDAYAHFQYGGNSCGQFLQSVEEYKKFGKTEGAGFRSYSCLCRVHVLPLGLSGWRQLLRPCT